MEESTAPSALDELERDGSSRKRFLRLAGGSAVAGALSAALAACGGGKKEISTPAGAATSAVSRFGQGDLGILRYALFLEYIEADFYTAAEQSGNLTGTAATLAKTFGRQEAEHVAALEGFVRKQGGTPPPRPQPKFPLDTQRTILQTAETLENVGAAAYLGQLDRIQSKEVLAAALAIHTVEARHAATLAIAIGHPYSPDGPFAKPLSGEEVTGQIQTFLSG